MMNWSFVQIQDPIRLRCLCANTMRGVHEVVNMSKEMSSVKRQGQIMFTF